MMVCIGYKSSWGVEMRKNQQRKDTLVEDVQRPTPSPSHLVFRTMEKSKDRRGSSRSLFGSLLQRATSFRSMSKKSPKRSSASEFEDIDPKFTNVEFKFNQDIVKNTVIIPLHSPDDSPEEFVASDSECNITRAVVHVSYEPTQQSESKTESTENAPDRVAVTSQNKAVKDEYADKDKVVGDSISTVNIVKEDLANSNEYDCKTTNNLSKPGESLLSPGLSRSLDPVHSANSNDTSPDSEVMSTLTIVATEEEKKKLFSHPNSVEEELPHVPTTLPLERSIAVPIVPVKHRIAETKTCSLDRPTRCSTPNAVADLPSGLGTYAIAAAFEDAPTVTNKIQITLPKFKTKATTTAAAPVTGTADGGADHPPHRRRRARSVNGPPAAGCPRGRWVDFDDDAAAGRAPPKPRSPKKITALPASMRPQRRRSSSTNATTDPRRGCGCDCHEPTPPQPPRPDPWPAITRNRSDTT